MDFLEVFVEASETGIELASGVCYANGITGIMIEDSRDFDEFMKDPNRQWDYIDDELMKQKQNQRNGITFFVTDNASGIEMLNEIKAALKRVAVDEAELQPGSLEISVKNVKEEDWANNWKKYFKPIKVGEKLLIRPTWEDEYDAEGRAVLHLEPGLAFGTGTHETTRLCMELLEKYLEDKDTVLDMGCGSGILSVAALLLGAESAVGVDIDPLAVKTAIENAEINSVGDKFEGICGNLTEKVTGKYNVVLANIVADIVILLSQDAPNFMYDDTIYIMSGIIDTREDDVLAAITDTFEIIERREEKGWVAMAAKLRK